MHYNTILITKYSRNAIKYNPVSKIRKDTKVLIVFNYRFVQSWVLYLFVVTKAGVIKPIV